MRLSGTGGRASAISAQPALLAAFMTQSLPATKQRMSRIQEEGEDSSDLLRVHVQKLPLLASVSPTSSPSHSLSLLFLPLPLPSPHSHSLSLSPFFRRVSGHPSPKTAADQTGSPQSCPSSLQPAREPSPDHVPPDRARGRTVQPLPAAAERCHKALTDQGYVWPR